MPRRQMLIADDNHDAADSLAHLVELFGYDPVVAYDGRAAIELAARWCPDVAVLDINMPGADGYAVAARLRAICGPKALLVALTGAAPRETREKAIEAGFDLFFVKPLDSAVLRQFLKNVSASPPDTSVG